MLSAKAKVIAANLERLRKERDLSFEDLGELAGVNRHSIYSFLKRGHSPSLDMAIELADALGVSFEDLRHPSRKPAKAAG